MSFHDIELPRKARAQSYATKAAVLRVIEAARASGLDVKFVEVRKDGTIRIGELESHLQPESEFDRLEREGAM